MAQLRIRNASNSGWIDAASAAGLRVRNASNSGWVNKSANLTGLAVRNPANTGWITFASGGGGGGVSYAVTPLTASVTAGQSVTFAVATLGVGATTLYWTLSGSAQTGDLAGGVTSGSVAVAGDAGSIQLTTSALATGGRTLIVQLRTGSTSGPVVATSSAVGISAAPAGAIPSQLSLYTNDLDFYIQGTPLTSSSDTATFDFTVTLDVSAFFSNGGNHIILAIDPEDEQGHNNPHCGPVIRNGQNLYGLARGFTIFADGAVVAEHWNNTASPGTAVVANTSGKVFNPASTPVFTAFLRAGYRNGSLGNTMTFQLFAGETRYGVLLYSGSVPWGWNWTGQHRAGVGIIGLGFRSLSQTGCVEEILPRSAPTAVLPFRNFATRVFG